MRFQFETSSLENDYGGRRYIPYVFIEEGVAMLATLLKFKVVTQFSTNMIDKIIEIEGVFFNE